jgi:hypothetical protein
MFIAVGEGGSILTSPDALTWTPQVSNTELTLFTVAGGAGSLVAAASNRLLSSSDGIQWKHHTTSLFKSSLVSVTYGQGTFVAVGGDFYAAQGVVVSPLGGASNGVIALSADGISWREVTHLDDGLSGVVNGSGQLVAVGERGRVMRSPNGESWSIAQSKTTNSLYGVTFGNDQYVAVGRAGTVITSNDGSEWTLRKSDVSDPQLEAVTFGNGQFVAVGFKDRYGSISTSRDGITWTNQRHNDALFGVTFEQGVFIAVGLSGTILTSSDGINWSKEDSQFSIPLQAITYGPSGFLAVGYGLFVTSVDGHTWKQHEFPAVGLLGGATYGSNSVVVVGGEGILQSAALAQLILLQPRVEENQLRFSIQGQGNAWEIQTSTNASSWTQLITQTNTECSIRLDEPPDAKDRMRFYRAVVFPSQ